MLFRSIGKHGGTARHLDQQGAEVAGRLAMQQRKTWGVMADSGFTPDLFVDCEPFGFKKSMEGFGVGAEIR